MRVELDVHSYVQDLEKHLRLTLFGGGTADPEGADYRACQNFGPLYG